MINYTFIEDQYQIQKLINELSGTDYISIDSESDGLYSYADKLCLVQLEFNGKIYLIDTLKVDITPMKEVFESNSIEKIFHSAYSDISMIKKNIKSNFVNIFDIMIASKYIFKKAVSLSNLVNNYFNFQLNKKFQKTNWGKRPLNNELLDYAAMDVYYLKKLRDIFLKDLKEKGLYEEFRYTCEKLSRTPPKTNEFTLEKYISMAHTYCMEGMEFSIFLEIVKKREEVAQKLNLPPFKIITNELLLYIAKHYDEILNAKDIKLYNRCIVRNIEWIRASIKSVIEGEVKYFNNNFYRNGGNTDYEIKLKMLKKWRREKSEKTVIPCELIVDLHILKQIARLDKIDLNKLVELGMDEKRIEKYGNDLINFFNSLQKKE